jgi:hypothetical protein
MDLVKSVQEACCALMNKAAATDWRQVRPHCDSCARTFCGSHRQCTSLQARDRSLKEEFGR